MSGECDKCSEHAVDCKCQDNMTKMIDMFNDSFKCETVHPMTECRVCNEMQCTCQTVKLFMGWEDSQIGGFHDFIANFNSIEEARMHVEESRFQRDWAHMVVNDEIVFEGIRNSREGKYLPWEWSTPEEASKVAPTAAQIDCMLKVMLLG